MPRLSGIGVYQETRCAVQELCEEVRIPLDVPDTIFPYMLTLLLFIYCFGLPLEALPTSLTFSVVSQQVLCFSKRVRVWTPCILVPGEDESVLITRNLKQFASVWCNVCEMSVRDFIIFLSIPKNFALNNAYILYLSMLFKLDWAVYFRLAVYFCV